MERLIEELAKLPLEAQIAYAIIGAVMLAAFFLWPAVFYYSFRLPVLATAWTIRKFKSKPDDKDDNTPAV
ncbi:hypothetical protein [Brucella intermedia]|uniref:hypothetical protein n=1 Tax=Brucella intermedia TaxID=94625 RepID=UPI000EFC93ED|nr:hypothetical protein [Brucella intermedia]KAB2720384.1 hypothetical protein F9K75_04750 [Brucella intermedia]